MAQWSEELAGKRIRKAESDKSTSDELLREAMELTVPDRENFYKRAKGEKKPGRAYDSSAGVSVMRAAGRLSSDLTPQFQEWLEIVVGPAGEALDDETFQKVYGSSKEEARGKFQRISKVANAVFGHPNFGAASNEMYVDYMFGTGGMSIQENIGEDGQPAVGMPAVFRALPSSHFYPVEGAQGNVDQWYFWHEVKPSDVTREWPDAKMTEELTRLAEDQKKCDVPVRFASIVYYDEKAAPKTSPRQGGYRFEVFYMRGRNTCERIVERVSRTPAFISPRYYKVAGENRGRGPVIFALPDIRTANKITELTLKSCALELAGVWKATERHTGPVKIKPAAVIKVRDQNSLTRLDTRADLNFGELLLEKLQENIRKVLGDNSLPSTAGPIRTATEFVERARELLSDQAAGFARLYAEFIVPAAARVVDILERRQIIDLAGLEIDGFYVDVRLRSPLAQAEALRSVENLVRFIEILTTLGGQEMAGVIVKLDAAAMEIARLMDIGADFLNSEEDRKKAMKGLAQRLAAQEGGDPAVAGRVAEQEAQARAA
jgi:hypothetical protein